MAIQFTDFSKAPLLDSPAKTIFQDVLKGYKMSKEPEKMADEDKQRKLTNKLKEIDVEHKPKQYELDDRGKSLANSLKSKALEHYEEKYALDKQLKQAQIKKALRAPNGSPAKFNGIVANYVASHPGATQDEIRDFADRALKAQLEHMQKGSDRIDVLNNTQNKRNLTPLGKKFDELREIREGKFPGTNDKLNPQQQREMESKTMLSLIKDTTDPRLREQLVKGNNMNITLGSINVPKLVSYSGIEGEFIDKPLDAILEGFGEGSEQYQDYIQEVNKANFAAKQMRQYLGDSIQPSAQAKLDKLTKPEAWNVSKETAEKNFNFMKELYDQEVNTLVRAMNDPSLYSSSGATDNEVVDFSVTVSAPEIPSTVRSKEDFKRWLKTLTPSQRKALKDKHVGGR